MPKTAGKISKKQAAIDKGWALYHAAMDACDELQWYLEELADEHDVEVPDETQRASYTAHAVLESKFSEGCLILPKHSSDGGKA